ncbi:hypothetical protein GCM10023149_50760 [Mucilaginibacter gynuensis]|uniref:Fibronectin type-III domain-containing protein n=2 Tax=Mucilaginibacter gynuensis TaxID=1302236 RepID=A0ABP8HIB6_9SPHI
MFLLLFLSTNIHAQRIYADKHAEAVGGICVGCGVLNPELATDGNPQTTSVLSVFVGIGSQTAQEVIFDANKPVANTQVRLKLGTGDNLVDLTALGRVSIQAFNGTSPVGPEYAAPTLLSALSSNNQFEVSITPTASFDRIRVTLHGGLVALLSSLYIYDGYYTGNAPALCNTAVDELHGISSALLGLGLNVGGVANPARAIDGNLNTASTLNAGVGLLGAYAQQTIIFNQSSVIGDSVRLTLSLPQALIDAGVFTRITLTSYTGNVSNNDEQLLNSALLSLRLLDLSNNRRRVTVTYAPTKTFDRVELKLGGGIANVLSTLDLYEAQRLIPRPVIRFNNATVSNVQTCAGSTVALSVTAVPNTTFNWYTQETGGTPVATGNNFTTPALTTTTTYYVAASRTGCTDASERAPVTITVNQIPAAPVITNNNVTVCPGQPAIFAAQNVQGVTINWYTTPTGGSPVFTGNTFTTPNITANTNYYAEAVAGGTCVSTARTLVTATVSTLPANPTLTAANVSVCSGDVATLSVASPVSGIIYKWYSTATGGTPLFTGVNFTTPALTANANYYVEAENATGCASGQRAHATVTVQPKPANPILAANSLTIAAGQTTTIIVNNAQTGITYNWYTSANAATPIHTGTTFTTPALFTNTTYYVGAANATGCTSVNRTPVTISVTIDNNSPCVFAKEQSSNVNGICIGCGVDLNNLAIDADTTTASSIHVLAGLLGGFAEQELRFQQSGVSGDTVRIVVQAPVALADVGVLGHIEVALYNGTNEVVRYSLDNALIKLRLLGAGNRYAISVPATGAYDRVTIRLTSGVATLLTSLNVFYAIQQYAAPVFNPLAPEICKGSTAQINITSPSAGIFNWYTAPTGGSPVFTGANFTTPALTANTTYYVENSRNGCAGSVRYPVQVLVNDPPVKPVVVPSTAAIFSGQTATFTASAGNNATIKWYTVASGGTPVFTGNTFVTPALSANTTYYAESSVGSCVNPDRTVVTVTVTPIVIPDVAVNPPVQAVNPGTSATITASSTTPGTVFNWYTAPTGGTSIFTGPVFNTPAVFANTTYYAEAVVTATGAKSATRAAGVVNVNNIASSPVPCDAAIAETSDINGLLCLGCSISNNAGAIDNDRNTFSRLDVPVGLLNAYAQQTLRFAGTGRAGDSVVVELGLPGTLANVNVLSQIGIATYNGTTFNNDRFSVNGALLSIRLLDGASRFRVAFKAAADFDRVEIRLNSSLAGVFNALNIYDASQAVAAPVIAVASTAVCQGSQATLTATAPDYVTVKWYTSATGGSPVFTGKVFNTPALNNNTTYYAEATRTATGCVQGVRTPATVTVSPVPVPPAVAATDVTICAGQTATFTAQAVTGVTFTWFTAPTGGTPIFTGTQFTTAALNANASYYVEANSGSCGSASRTKVNAVVNPTPANPVVTAASSSIQAGQTATLNVTNAQANTTYNWYTSANAATPIHTGTTFTTPALFTNTTYYVGAANATGCTSVSRTPVTISVTIDNNSPCVFAKEQSSNVNGICIGCGVDLNNLAIDADTTTASSIHVLAGLLGGFAEQELRFQQPGVSGDTVRIVVQAPVALADVGVLGHIEVALYNGANEVVRYSLDNALIKLRLLGAGNHYAISVPATGAYDRVTIRLTSGVATLLTSLNVFYAIQQYAAPVFNPLAPEICKGSTAQINITSPSAGIFNWYTAPTGGSPVFTGANFTTPALTANTTYYVENSRNGCAGSVRYPVQVLVNDPPVKPVVVPSTAAIFSGQTATFTASAGNNATIKWYTVASGGTPVFTGNTFVTPALSANTTYYAESSVGSCVNPDRTVVTVTVTPIVIPDVAVNPPVQAVNPGTSATITASSTTPGTVFNWYTAPTGGTSIFTGPVFNTPAVFANTTYYAEAVVTATGAKSATRAAGVVNVNNIASSPVPCDAAIAETSDINGLLCLGCSISNNAGAIDNDRNTFSRLDVPVGLLNAYAQQTLRFAGTGRAGDSVVVELGLPGTLANVNVLSQIGIATYNGTTFNNDRFSVNGALLSIRLLDGASRFRVAFKAAADFDRVEIRLNSSLAGVFNALNIYDASQAVAAPVIAVASTAVCQGSQATLTATAPDYVTVKWYTSATGGSPVFTGKVFNTPALNNNTTYYAEATRTATGCVQGVRTPATVTVSPVPVPPAVAATDVTICAGQTATFTAQAVTGVTFTWFTAPTGGTPIFTGTQFTTAALNANASYYVEANSGSCGSSSRTKVNAVVTQTPLTPTVSQTPVETCSGSSAVLAATSTQPGVTFNWYTAATGGTPIFTGPQFTTPALTASTSYYVEAASGSCVSSTRAKADVQVNPTPANATVTVNPINKQVTSGQTATLTASSTTAGATFKWYTTATGGTAIFTGAAFTTPALTSTTTYYAEASIASSGCISVQRTAVTITVNPIFATDCDFASTQTNEVVSLLPCVGCVVTTPDDAVDQNITNFSQLNLPVSVLGSYAAQKLIFDSPGIVGDTVTVRLSVPASLANVGVLNRISIGSFNGANDNNDRINLSNNLISIQLLAGEQTALVKFAPGAAFDRVEVRLNSVVAAVFNTLNIYYASKRVEQPVLAANTVNICSGGDATFTVSNARAGVTYRWYTAATGGSPVFTGTSFTATNVQATTTYYVESSRGTCPNPNRVAATVNVTPSPVTPTLAQNNLEICAGETVTLTVTNANGATVRWYNAATNGTLLFTGASYTVSPIANVSYYAETSNGTCTSPARAQATIKVNARPAQPGVQLANVEVCAGSPATLAVATPEAGVTYKWYTSLTGGTAVFTGPTYTTGNITASTSFFVEASNTLSGCVNNGGRTQVDVDVTTLPLAPTLSATTSEICNGGTISISVNNPVAGTTYNWYTAATGGTPVFTGTVFTASNITADATYYVEAVSSTSCISTTRTATAITVLPIPTPPQVQVAGGNAGICAGTTATLSITNPQANLVYRWYSAATNGTLLFTGTVYNTAVLTANTTYYVEAANAGNCTSSARTSITVTVNALPADPTLASNTASVCVGTTASLAISSPVAGIIYKWYDSPALTNLVHTGSTFVTDPINVNTTFYVSATNASGCVSDNVATAQVTVLPAPNIPVIAGGNTAQTCTGNTVTLAIQNPDANQTYNWYTTATGGTPVFTGPSFTTAALTGNVTYYAEAVNTNGGCASSSRAAVTVTVNPLPVAPVVTAQGGSTTPSVCGGSGATLTATSTTPNVTFNWYTAANGGTPVFSGATYTTPALNATTTYYVEATTATGCASSTRTAITVTVTQPPSTPVPTNATASVCAGSGTTLSVSSPLQDVTYKWYGDANRTNLLATGTTFNTGAINATTTFYLEASRGTCTSAALATVVVTVTAAPTAPAVANNGNQNTCNNTAITLDVVNPQAGVTYNWYTAATGGTAIFTGASFVTPVLTANTTYYVEAATAGGCTSATRTAVPVTVTPAPPAPQANAQSTAVCPGETTTINAVANTGITINWYDVATGGTPIHTGDTFTTGAITSATTYYVEAVSNTGGCASTTRTAVTVDVVQALQAPIVTAGAVTKTTVTFNWNSVPGATEYEISTDNGQTFTSVGNALVYTPTGLQPNTAVTLIVRALGNSACEISANSNAVTLTTDKPNGEIFVPNAFTPNGDGNNDILLVYGSNIQTVNFYVYDQWGELVFKSNNQGNGWDGTFKGSRLPVGVYVYYMDATTTDGQKVNKKGTITLLR